MKSFVLGIDIGTTALKMAVFTREGKIAGSTVCEYALKRAEGSYAEADCDSYYRAIRCGLETLKAEGIDISRISQIGLSSQSETIFFLDREKRPLRPAIIWLDERAVVESDYLNRSLVEDECYRVTGQPCVQPAWPAAKILWIQRNEPAVWEKTAFICLMEDFILNALTGRRAVTGSILSTTAYWNIREKRYWGKMLQILSVKEDMLSEVLPSGHPVGKVLPEVAEDFGLSPSTIVYTGGMDNAVGAYGAGCRKPGQMAYSIGSSLSLTLVCEEGKLRNKSDFPMLNYVTENDIYHVFTLGGMCFRWLRDNFFPQETKEWVENGEDGYDRMTELASTVPAGCGGLMCLPHFSGSVAPDVNPHAKGVFYGITLEHDRAWFTRAVMESIGLVIRRCMEALQSTGNEVTELIAFGGGAKSALWNQIISDILQKPVRVTDTQHAGCRGAAMLAAGGFGNLDQETIWADSQVYMPKPEMSETYDSVFCRYKKLMAILDPAFSELS